MVTVEGDALVSVVDNKVHRRLEFDLPRYKTFIQLNRFSWLQFR